MKVKTVFLNGYLNEEVYMEQTEGFVNLKYPNRVCKIKRSIYGLKQASRQWNKRFDDEIKKFSFTQNRDEPCVYLKASGSNITFLILYVDDILIMGNNIPMLQDVKSYLERCFAMKDLGEAAYILGIKIYRDRSRRLIGLCQSAYIKKILKRYCMENSKRGVVYGGDLKLEPRVSCYTDNGYLADADDLKSQTGYVFILNGGVVDWKSAITELVHLIFFEQKVKRIPIWLSEIEFCLITFNLELHIFYTFSDDDVSNPQVDCIEEMNFVVTT
nr:putative retrotransposon protein [Tanacetum cinerariifolium]